MAQAFRDIRRKESLLRKQERDANEEDELKKAGEARPATLKNRIRGLKRLLNSGVREDSMTDCSCRKSTTMLADT